MSPLLLLAAATRDHDRGAWRMSRVADAEVAGLIATARVHGLEAWMAGSMTVELAKNPVWAELAAQRSRFVAARARARGELDRFAAVADVVGLPWVAVKGQAVAESLYPRPQLRFGVDIDVLVPPSGFSSLTDTLLESGWQLLDRNWPLTQRTEPGQLRFVSPTGGLFDVHWNLMNNPALRTAFPMATDVLLARRRQLPSGLWALSEDDQLVHLGLHAALSGASRLMWLLDVGLAADAVTDWPRLARAATAAGAGPALSLVLRRARRWLHTPAPADALSSMAGSFCWPSMTAVADRLSPLSADPERPAISRSLARSARGSAGSSAVEFGHHLFAFLRSGAPRSRRPSPLADAEDPRSPLFAVADPIARASYLSSVASNAASSGASE